MAKKIFLIIITALVVFALSLNQTSLIFAAKGSGGSSNGTSTSGSGSGSSGSSGSGGSNDQTISNNTSIEVNPTVNQNTGAQSTTNVPTNNQTTQNTQPPATNTPETNQNTQQPQTNTPNNEPVSNIQPQNTNTPADPNATGKLVERIKIKNAILQSPSSFKGPAQSDVIKIKSDTGNFAVIISDETQVQPNGASILSFQTGDVLEIEGYIVANGWISAIKIVNLSWKNRPSTPINTQPDIVDSTNQNLNQTTPKLPDTQNSAQTKNLPEPKANNTPSNLPANGTVNMSFSNGQFTLTKIGQITKKAGETNISDRRYIGNGMFQVKINGILQATKVKIQSDMIVKRGANAHKGKISLDMNGGIIVLEFTGAPNITGPFQTISSGKFHTIGGNGSFTGFLADGNYTMTITETSRAVNSPVMISITLN